MAQEIINAAGFLNQGNPKAEMLHLSDSSVRISRGGCAPSHNGPEGPEPGKKMTSSNASLEVEQECIRLCVDFANGVDQHDDARVLDLFSADALLQTPAKTYRGRAEIAGFLEERSRSVATRHLCTNIRIAAQSESVATGRCYVLLFSAACEAAPVYPLKAPAPFVAEYSDEFVKTSDGWRIRERRIQVVFTPN
jgi:ketosteroid isomerase-like protein